MANKKFLDNNGLLYFWQKIVNAFVKKDGNKVLSEENYSTAEKEKLAGLKNYTLPKATTTMLGGIKAGAGVEVTEDGTLNATGGGVADSVDWSNVQNKPTKISDFTNDSGFQTASDVQSAINSAVSSAYKYKGSVANRETLPGSPELGDVYNLEDTGMNVAWNGTTWDDLGSTIDLSDYVQESELVAITNQEIDTIVAQ